MAARKQLHPTESGTPQSRKTIRTRETKPRKSSVPPPAPERPVKARKVSGVMPRTPAPRAAAPAGSGTRAKSSEASSAAKLKTRPIKQAAGVSSEAVARRTGRSWAEWFALLDSAGAQDLDHKNIVAILAQRHGVGPWWQQMITVAYEQARGKREKHETSDGYQVGASKTLSVALSRLYRLWLEPSERDKWLGDNRFTIHKATAGKSIRARWGRGSSRIDVYFYDKGAGKCEVAVQHNRIDGSSAAAQMKAYWAKKLAALEKLLGGG